MDLVGVEFFQQSKRNFLYSIAIANLAVGYSTMVIEDGMVDNPPSRGPNFIIVNSLSPSGEQ